MIGVLVCLLTILSHLSEAFTSFTFVDKYLDGYELKTLKVEDWLECIKCCQDEPLCISYNYDRNNTCQLNRHGVGEHCQAGKELLSHRGWIFQQIRKVTKRMTKLPRQGSCPCNCGTSKKCYIKPKFGEAPDKAAKTCQDILDRRGSVPDGAYYLEAGGSISRVYCQMTSIPGCGNYRGWTLVMKINGSKKNFKYKSVYWEPTTQEYKTQNGESLDEKETKLNTFSSISFTKMCLGMKAVNSSVIHWITRKRSRPISMAGLFSLDSSETFELNKSTWLSLINGSSLKEGKTEEGTNVKQFVRIGMVAELSGNLPTSYIGFGTTDKHNITCGNVHGQKSIPAFCYILVMK